jgi:GTPase
MHRSGFVNIIGKPNVGKSTLMNGLMKDRLSIITSKPQTTRHRIFGIMSEHDYQAIFSDSPGIISNPRYGLQKVMNKYAYSSFEDADLLLFVIDLFEDYESDDPTVQSLQKTETPKILIINKTDLDKENKAEELEAKWSGIIDFKSIYRISALNKEGIDELRTEIVDSLPEGPAYYDKDQISDKPERFFVSEIIREKLLIQYKQEIPYACEVVIESFKEEVAKSGPILKIFATIYVERPNQKYIIIGNKGSAIKNLGIESRKGIEEFFGKHVFLELFVKVKENWRDSDRELKYFGYEQ